MKKALILDLDNTIYPVSSIADHLFVDLFRILDEHAESIKSDDPDAINKIKHEMTRTPFQKIADEFKLDADLRAKMTDMLKHLTYDRPMQTFDEYVHLKNTVLNKFLVTTGFLKLQWSKVKMLGIESDFKEIFIVDPEASDKTKKDIFSEIMQKYGYKKEQLLVIGDDPESEIKAATVLGIDTFLYDAKNQYNNNVATYRSDKLQAALDHLD